MSDDTPYEPMTDEELQPIRQWREDIGIGSDGFYIEVTPVARMLEYIDHLRTENASLLGTIEDLRHELQLARSNVAQPSLFESSN